MNWFNKIAGNIRPLDINEHLYGAILHIVGGEFKWVNPRILTAPAKYQQYGVIDIVTKNVIQQDDVFYIKVFHYIRRGRNTQPLPYDYADEAWEEWKKNNPIEKIDNIDSVKGHPFVSFRGFIEGRKPDMQDIEREEDFPIKHVTVRRDMVNIGSFENLDTPYEVATFVRSAIERFYRPDNGEDDVEDDSPTPSPTINSPAPVGVSS